MLSPLPAYSPSRGLLNAYGAYVSYYSTDLLADYSSTAIAWPGTLQAVLIISVGVLSGPLFDRGHLVPLLLIGSFLVVFGMMMLSLSTQYYQILLAQGICVGLGSGIIYVPSLALVSISFPPRTRALALALATCGAAVGGVVFPIALQQLLPLVGFAWATRILAFMALFCFAVGDAIILSGRGSLTPQPPRSLLDWSALRDPTFLPFCLALFAIFLAYYVPFFYIPDYVHVVLGASTTAGVDALVIANAATLPGRLASALVARRLGATETLLLAVAANAVVLFAWLAVTSLPAMDAWIVVFGLVAGPLVTIPAAVVPEICPSLSLVGTRLGMAWLFAAAGGLVGAPVAGVLNHAQTRDFRGSQALVGAAMTVGALLLVLPLRTSMRRARERKAAAVPRLDK